MFSIQGSGTTKLKIKEPDLFYGDRSQFRHFEKAIRAGVKFGGLEGNTEQQIVWATSFLRGKPADWFDPYFNDYLKKKKKDWKAQTTIYFRGGIDVLLTDMERLYGNKDEVMQLELQLRTLSQRGSVADYTAEFRQIAGRLDKDDTQLYMDYKLGLKEWIQREIARQEDDPDTLQELIDYAERLDERFKQLGQIKRGQFQPQHQPPRRPKVPSYSKDPRNPDAMDWQANMVVATQREPRQPQRKNWAKVPKGNNNNRKKRTMTDEQQKRFKSGECINCGRKGHYAKDCRQGKRANMVVASEAPNAAQVKEAKPVEEAEITDMSDTRHPKHGTMSWTACYDDNCYTHLGDKQGAGWFPRRPKNKRVNVVRVVERDPRVLTCDEEKTIIETWFWKQIQTQEDEERWEKPRGTLVHDDTLTRRDEPMQITLWHQDNVSETSEAAPLTISEYLEGMKDFLSNTAQYVFERAGEAETTPWQYHQYRYADLHLKHVIRSAEEVRRTMKQIDEEPKYEDDQTHTLSWEEGKITINTQEWRCRTCMATQGCRCTAWDKFQYIPGTTPTGAFAEIILRQCHRHMCDGQPPHAHHMKDFLLNKPIPILIKGLKDLPHRGKHPRQYTKETENPTSDKETDSSEDMSKPGTPDDHTWVVEKTGNTVTVQTTRWFVDWCRNPECEQDGQHKHKYFDANGQARSTTTLCVWYRCITPTCINRTPHAHQMCFSKGKQTLPLSYFIRLPTRAKDEPSIPEERQSDEMEKRVERLEAEAQACGLSMPEATPSELQVVATRAKESAQALIKQVANIKTKRRSAKAQAA